MFGGVLGHLGLDPYPRPRRPRLRSQSRRPRLRRIGRLLMGPEAIDLAAPLKSADRYQLEIPAISWLLAEFKKTACCLPQNKYPHQCRLFNMPLLNLVNSARDGYLPCLDFLFLFRTNTRVLADVVRPALASGFSSFVTEVKGCFSMRCVLPTRKECEELQVFLVRN